MASISELAERIARNGKVLDKYLESQDLPPPSLDSDAPEEFPITPAADHAWQARLELLRDAKSLHDIVSGPGEVLRRLCWTMTDLGVLKVVYRFGMHDAVPLEGGATYEEIAATTGLPEVRVRSILRQAALNRIFEEDKPDHVVHTAVSAILVRNRALRDFVGHVVEDALPAYNSLPDALQRFAGSEEPGDSAFSLAFNTKDPMYTFFNKHRERQDRFFGAMEYISRAPNHSYDHVVNGYRWQDMKDATIVDVGGSSGFLSKSLARAYPEIARFVVQDFEDTIEAGRAEMHDDPDGRVEFMAHDIFDPQPIQADLYVLRHICHNWPDAYAIQILRQIVPAMKPTSKILLLELVMLPPHAADGMVERYMRNGDLTMFALLNTQERSAEHWRNLVAQADGRLRVANITQPEGSWDSIIEVSLTNLDD